jgi:transcriptional regulator with XRE-family HTH domain
MEETNLLGSKMQSLRKDLNMTQAQLADRSLVSRAAISQFESGISRPSLLTLTRLSIELGYDLAREFSQSEPIIRKKQSPVERGIITIASQSGVYTGPFPEVISEDLYVKIPFVSRGKHKEFILHRHEEDKHSILQEVWIPRTENAAYDNAVIFEVNGNKMAPRYPENSKHIIRFVEQAYWAYSSGVHLIALKNGVLMFRRIASNEGGNILLISDMNEERIEISLSEIDCMWKAGECLFISAED